MRRWILILSCVLALTLLALPAARGQQLRSGGKRKIVAQVRPVYPPIARKMNLTGTVRLLAVVSPAGSVVRTETLGGSPVLVQAGADAVSKSKWEAGPQETHEIIEIKFQPDTD